MKQRTIKQQSSRKKMMKEMDEDEDEKRMRG